MKLKIEAASGIGSRMTQEDCLLLGEKPIETLPRQNVPAFYVDTAQAPTLTAVLDGVGSCSYASLASSMTAAKIQSVFYSKEEGNEQLTAAERLGTACGQASEKLAVLNQSFGSIQAATTVTAAAFSKRQLHLWAVGDSPAYLYRQNRLTPLFKPMGEGNRLLAFAGADARPEFVASTHTLEAGDTVVLSTDGILRSQMLLWALRLGLSAQAIVRLSTLRRFADNSTLIKIEVVEV